MKKLLLYINTIKYLKISQIFYRIKRRLIRIIGIKSDKFYLKKPKKKWVKSELVAHNITDNLEANFLNFKKKLNLPKDWNSKKLPKLWVYNLHYLENLVSIGGAERVSFNLSFLDSWIKDNPSPTEVGWEPYPTSLRLSNALIAWLNGLPLTNIHFKSLYRQSQYLSKNLEKDILGNHYFANLKALFFAGIIFQRMDWSSACLNELKKQILEQIHEDGGNFELSPMYHSIILKDMLDIYNLFCAYKIKDNNFKHWLQKSIFKMLNYLDKMSHGNKLSFFNDSVDGIAPESCQIFDYAEKLGIKLNQNIKEGFYINDFSKSGYIVAEIDGAKTIFDAGKIGPDYQPGHAHADTLSIEFSFEGEKYIVNSGISEYGDTKLRHFQRSTKSHSTVEINGKNSSEIWSSFRVGNRAKIVNRHFKIDEKELILNACHDGYSRVFRPCVHSRKISMKKDQLSVTDVIHGKFNSAISRFYFHPSLDFDFQKEKLIISGLNCQLILETSKLDFALKDTYYYPEFGLSIPNKCLEINFFGNKSEVVFLIHELSQ